MKKSNILIAILSIAVLASSCGQEIPQVNIQNDEANILKVATVPYKELLSPEVVKMIHSSKADEEPNPADLLPKEDFTHEYVNHFKFFTEIDVTGSTVEEILQHDGYVNAHKYVRHWRDLLGENMDWPDHQSTTYKGPFPAMEHGLTRKGKGWFGLRNAKQKAEEYYNRALSSWKKGVSPTDPQQKEAWEWLGRTAHFIQDSTVPHHSMVLLRFDQLTHSPYEKRSSQNFRTYFPSKNYNPGTWNNGGPYPAQGKWGIYSNKNAAEVVENNLNIANGLFRTVNHREDEKNGNWDKSRSLMLPLASKTCAGLIVGFLEKVGETP